MHKQKCAVEDVYATTNILRYLVEEKVGILPNIFEEVIDLPAKMQWKATSDKEVAYLKMNSVYTLLPATSITSGHKIIGSRWDFEI